MYDITVEGVSLIKIYRSQFGKIIHKDSFDVLMDKLNAKVKKLEDGEDSAKDGKEDNNDKI